MNWLKNIFQKTPVKVTGNSRDVNNETAGEISNSITDSTVGNEAEQPVGTDFAPKDSANEIAAIIQEHRQDLDFLVENLHEFDVGNGNPYQFYWLRSHSSQPENECLYGDFRSVMLGAAMDENLHKIIFSRPDFSSPDQSNIAFNWLVAEISDFIKSEAARGNVHPGDRVVHECCVRLWKGLRKATLKDILQHPEIDAKNKIEKQISKSYAIETAHLYSKLEEKKPFLKSKFIQATRVEIDEYGEPSPNLLIDVDIENMLSGINLHNGFSDEFRLFNNPEEDFVTYAIEHMTLWVDSLPSSEIPQDGFEFETWVADQLNEFGWSARATVGSGDQGVDVVAVRDVFSVGIQCKRYSSSVGNKAVQEVYSGAKHMGLDRAVVLTNASYTKSAKELSKSTGVLLASVDDLPELYKLVRDKPRF